MLWLTLEHHVQPGLDMYIGKDKKKEEERTTVLDGTIKGAFSSALLWTHQHE